MNVMKSVLLSIVFTLVSIALFGQNPDVHLASERSKTSSPSSKMVNTRHSLRIASVMYVLKDYPAAVNHANRACHFCDEIKSRNLKGIAEAANGDLPSADKTLQFAYNKCLELGRDPDTILYNHILVKIKRKDYHGALDKMSMFYNSAFKDYFPLKAFLLAENGNIEDAIEVYNNILIGDQQDDLSYYNLGLLYIKQGNDAEATRCIERALEINKNWEYCLALGNLALQRSDFVTALQYYGEAYNKNPKNKNCVQAYADILSNQGEYQKAEKLYKNLLSFKGMQAKAYAGLGDCNFMQKKLSNAKIYYQRAIQYDSAFESAYLGLGNIELQNFNHAKAIEIYNQALAIDPSNPYTFEKRGIALFRIQHNSQADDDFEKVLSLEPDYKFSYDAFISFGFSAFNLKNYDVALSQFKQAIEKNPSKATGYDGLGCTQFETANYDEAALNLRKAVSIEPNNEIMLTNLGNALYQITKFDEAQNCFEKAIKINPINQHAMNGIGICSYQNNDYKSSVEWLEKALKLDTTTKDINLNLAVSRSHYIKELRLRNATDSANVQYNYLQHDMAKYQTGRQDSSTYLTNMGYIQTVWSHIDSAVLYYNKIINPYYNMYKLNNLGVTELLKTPASRSKAMEDFSMAQLEDKEGKYYPPKINESLMNDHKFDYNTATDPWIRKHVERDRYVSTYFYYSLMRYFPPAVENDLQVDIKPIQIKFHIPDTNCIVYKNLGACKMRKPRSPEGVVLVNRKPGKASTDCPVF